MGERWFLQGGGRGEKPIPLSLPHFSKDLLFFFLGCYVVLLEFRKRNLLKCVVRLPYSGTVHLRPIYTKELKGLYPEKVGTAVLGPLKRCWRFPADIF